MVCGGFRIADRLEIKTPRKSVCFLFMGPLGADVAWKSAPFWAEPARSKPVRANVDRVCRRLGPFPACFSTVSVHANVNNNAISSYVGLDRFEARKKILNELKEKNYFVKEENIKNKVPYGDRSNSIIEHFLTEQWFADAKKLSIKAKKIVKNKKTKFFPDNWSKTYFQWMNNIEPWCISRQLWWGPTIIV